MKADQVNVRYMVEDVDTLVDFYTKYLGFKLGTNSAPAFADVTRGNLRLLLSGKKVQRAERCLMEQYLFPEAGIVLSW